MEGNTDFQERQREQPAEEKIGSIEAKEAGPKIKYNFFFSPHYRASDVEAWKKNFEECDVYIPERYGWTQRGLEFIRKVADGQIRAERVRGKPEDPFLEARLSEARMIHNSHKPIAYIDVPKEQAEPDPWIDVIDLHDKNNFTEALDVVKDWVRTRYQIQKDREDTILSRLKPTIQELLKEYPSLKTKNELKVLITLGTMHTPVHHSVKKEEGDRVTRESRPLPTVFAFVQEAVRRLQFGKEIDNDLAAKIYLGDVFTYALFSDDTKNELNNLLEKDSEKGVKLERKIISQFSFEEAKEIFDKLKQGEGERQIFKAKFEEKEIQLPHTEQELDAYLAKPLPR
jgi:hypothetical protein